MHDTIDNTARLALVAEALDSSQLNLILLPTEKCNFDCGYCYEDHAAGAMRPGTIAGVERLIERRAPSLRTLRISWFGGEPLLQQSIIERIGRFCLAISSRYEGLNYISDMTTNGFLLTQPVVELLSLLRVKTYQISLDGDAETHDRSRVLRGGKPTFARIYENLVAIRKSDADLRVIIRVHFTRATSERLDGLITRLNQDFGDDRRFTVHFKAIEPLGGPNGHRITKLGRDEQSFIYTGLVSKLRNAWQREETETLATCYATVGNSFLVYPTGEVGKCTVALHEPENLVGHLSEDGFLRVDRERFLPWLTGLENMDAGWLACPWRQMKPRRGADDTAAEGAPPRKRLPLHG